MCGCCKLERKIAYIYIDLDSRRVGAMLRWLVDGVAKEASLPSSLMHELQLRYEGSRRWEKIDDLQQFIPKHCT
jgi:hypothetical protein